MYEGLEPSKHRQHQAPDQNLPTESTTSGTGKGILPIPLLPLLLTKPPPDKRAADLDCLTNLRQAHPFLSQTMHSLRINWFQNDIVETWESNLHWFTKQRTSLVVLSKLLRKSGLAVETAACNYTLIFVGATNRETELATLSPPME